MKSPDNKFLIVKKGVVLTEDIDPVIHELDAYFKAANVFAVVTSGLRDAAAQLRIIRSALTTRGIAKDYQDAFDDIGKKIEYEGEEVYAWQPGWSKLLNIGYIVNPPYPAKVLMDYIRPGSTENKKGKIIGATPHATGLAFDVGGGANGLNDEIKVIESAKGKIKGLKGYLIERNNNAIHVDVEPLDLIKHV